jgi:hypothetical protein
MKCEPVCAEKIANLPNELRWGFLADKSIEAVPAVARPGACLRSCERQRAALAASLENRVEAVTQPSVTRGAGWKN